MNAVPSSTFTQQIQTIVSEANINFQNLRRQFNSVDSFADSIFASTIQIDGTADNRIWKATDGWVYSAIIAENTSTKAAIQTCDQWRDKLSMLSDLGFLLEKHLAKDSTPIHYGWKFSNAHLLVSIEAYPFSTYQHSNDISLAFFNWC